MKCGPFTKHFYFRNLASSRGVVGILTIEVKQVTAKLAMADAFAIRRAVFIHEQHVPEHLEIDAFEDEAAHFVAYIDGASVGVARLRWTDEQTAKAERIAVRKAYRGSGVGRALMHALEAFAAARKAHALQLHAQIEAKPFYERMGYTAFGDPFMDTGIEHMAMMKRLNLD